MIGLKTGAELESYRRMIRAGFKPKAIQSRILQVALERSLSAADVDRALNASSTSKGRDGYLMDFADRHNLNLNWLFFGMPEAS